MKKNNGFITKISVADKVFEIDGYVKRDVMETIVSHRTLLTLDWTDNLKTTEPVLAESNFIEDKHGNVLEVEFEDIDPYESRRFDNCLKLGKAIEDFVRDVK